MIPQHTTATDIPWPRTEKEYAILNRWILEGLSDEQISKKLTGKNWRSEVVTLAGKLHCAECRQPITITVCIECGQTKNERNQ